VVYFGLFNHFQININLIDFIDNFALTSSQIIGAATLKQLLEGGYKMEPLVKLNLKRNSDYPIALKISVSE